LNPSETAMVNLLLRPQLGREPASLHLRIQKWGLGFDMFILHSQKPIFKPLLIPKRSFLYIQLSQLQS
jgi:hypothetical protein